MSINNEKLGSRIRLFRTMNKLSQEDLSEKIGVNRTFISFVENGSKGISVSSLTDIANTLNVSTDDLLADSLDNPHVGIPSEIASILIDCSQEEQSILIHNMQSLSKKLKEYTIKK